MQRQIFLQEVKSLEELMEVDKECEMKVQVEESARDVKLLLERCREAHMHFLLSLNTVSDNREHELWIESLYSIRSGVNTKIAQHLQKLEQTKDSMFKIEKVKPPIFKGNIKHYAKFKSDFNKYIMPSIKLKETSPMVLRSCLDDKVKDLVINVEDNIERVWERLDEMYGNLADIVVNDVRKLKCIRERDNKGFISLIDTVERGYRDLALLGLEKEISNTETVSEIEERLPI